MGKFRVRSKTAKKGQRWAKGQSSSSNPASTKHREEAKNRMIKTGSFGGGQSTKPTNGTKNWPSKLTAESLLKHQALLGEDVDDRKGVSMNGDDNDDALTLGQTEKTFETFASDWTQCTNVSFGKLMRSFSTNNAHHREMLAILAAVTEVIKVQGGEETSTEYFAALLTTLESMDTEDGLSAVVSLLSMVIKTVPQEVIRSRFSKVAKFFLDLLARHGDSDNTAMVRALIGCLSVLLRAQAPSSWQEGTLTVIFDSLLTFTNHTKPKVRKASHHAICAVLRGSYFMLSDNAPDHHPAAARTAKYLAGIVESNAGSTANLKAVLHALILLKEVLGVFPKQQLKAACETILKVMTLGNAVTVSCGMQALHGLCSSRPNPKNFPAELNAQLISALYDYLPSINDTQPHIAWLAVQQEALINLSFLDASLCWAHLPRFYSTAVRGWTSDRTAVATAATTAMKAVANECIRSHVEAFSKDAEKSSTFKTIFGHVEGGLKYQCHTAWSQVLHLLSIFFEVAGSHFHQAMGSCLRSLADLRSSANFTLTNELDFVVGKAIRVMGPDVVLGHIPLGITGNEQTYEFQRSWLLPVLRENVQKTKLGFFKSYFLPIATACYLRAMKAKAENDKVLQKTYEVIVSQIWSLLPGFCNSPVDLKDNFKSLARSIGEHLQQRKELRLDILASLRQLILKSNTNEENKLEIARFAKNFLPILFNLYTTKPVGAEETGQRMSVFESIKLYFTLADAGLLSEMFDKAFTRNEDASTENFVRDSCLELLRVMMSFVDESRVKRMYDLGMTQLANKDHKIQKRSYRVLEEICGSGSTVCREFVGKNLSDIQRNLLTSLSKASPPSQASRLRCLIHIVRQLQDDNSKFVYSLIPEAVLCIKASNEKARSAAYTLLVVIGEALQRWHTDLSTEDIVREFLKVVLAGLAGSPSLVYCTLLAITRIFYEFRDLFPDDLTQLLIDNMCLLMTSTSREVVGATLSFLKVFVTTHPVLKSTRHVEKIVDSLTKMTEDSKRHFRLKSRYLLDRIVRKFGFDMVSSLVPKSDVVTHKRLKNLRKLQERRKKLGERQNDDDDADSDDGLGFQLKSKPKTIDEILADSDGDDMEVDQESTNRGKSKKKSKTTESYIAEKSEAIVDLLDPSAAQLVTTSKPNSGERNAQNKPKTIGDFQIAPDGRIIIKDDDDDDSDEEEDSAKKEKNLKYMMMEDSDEETGEKSENTFKNLVTNRKRKLGTSVASSKITAEPEMKYRSGGSGIHRPLAPSVAGSKPAKLGGDYKSKKAKGDVKRKGKPDPYAYVPLEKSSLNRRKKAKFEGQFKGLVKATQKGMKAGKKAKLVEKMKKMKV